MNGELHHACRLTAAVKYALTGELFSFACGDYEREPHFLFQDGSVAMGGNAWMMRLQNNGLRDVLLLSPATVKKDRNLLAFVGGAPFGIPAFLRGT